MHALVVEASTAVFPCMMAAAVAVARYSIALMLCPKNIANLADLEASVVVVQLHVAAVDAVDGVVDVADAVGVADFADDAAGFADDVADFADDSVDLTGDVADFADGFDDVAVHQ